MLLHFRFAGCLSCEDSRPFNSLSIFEASTYFPSCCMELEVLGVTQIETQKFLQFPILVQGEVDRTLLGDPGREVGGVQQAWPQHGPLSVSIPLLGGCCP